MNVRTFKVIYLIFHQKLIQEKRDPFNMKGLSRDQIVNFRANLI